MLRLGHRIPRDARITTHIGLVARAFGADGLIIADVTNHQLKESLQDVVKRWGGKFKVETGQPWLDTVMGWREKNADIIHLTMYGLPINQVIREIKKSPRDKLVVVGAEKVPSDLYEQADFNVSVTRQPHSEVAALAIFLDRLFEGKELKKEFSDAQLSVVPQSKGKKVRRR